MRLRIEDERLETALHLRDDRDRIPAELDRARVSREPGNLHDHVDPATVPE